MTTTDAQAKTIEIPRVLSVKELGDLMGVSPVEVIKELMKNGVMASINQVIDYDTAAIVATDMGFEALEAQAQEHREVVVEREAGRPTIEEDEPAPPDDASSMSWSHASALAHQNAAP